MQRRNIDSFKKVKLALLLVISFSMTLALGILIGQRNTYNSSFPGTLEVKSYNGESKNVFSEIKTSTIYELSSEPMNVGTFQYMIWDGKMDFNIKIETQSTDLKFQKEKISIPSKFNVEVMYYNEDQTDVFYEKLGEIEFKKSNENASILQANFSSSLTKNPLQVKQLVLKVQELELQQNFYQYNDKNIPEKLNGKPMPFYWTALL
ncbi:MAG: hypothetical protein ACRCXZ_00545 [Patescibacteria group bacterium]